MFVRSRDGLGEGNECEKAYLVQTPCITIEQYPHTIDDDLSCFFFGKRVLAAVDGVTEKGDGDVCAVACGD